VKTSTETVPTRHTCPLLTSPEHPGRLAGHAAWRGVPEGYCRAGESSDEADSSPPLPVGVGVNSALQCGLRAESHYRLPQEAAYLAHRGRLRQEEAYQLGVGLGYGLRVGLGGGGLESGESVTAKGKGVRFAAAGRRAGLPADSPEHNDVEGEDRSFTPPAVRSSAVGVGVNSAVPLESERARERDPVDPRLTPRSRPQLPLGVLPPLSPSGVPRGPPPAQP